MNLDDLTYCEQVSPELILFSVVGVESCFSGYFTKSVPEFEACQSLPVFIPLNIDEYNAKLEAEKQKEADEAFKQQRQLLLDNAVVKISTGKSFDADELSKLRMSDAIKACEIQGLSDPDLIPFGWSTADVPTGVMVDVTVGEIKEAFVEAVKNTAAIWSV